MPPSPSLIESTNEPIVWHLLAPEDALPALESTAAGLAPAEAESRRERWGPNQLEDKGIKSPWLILGEQLKSVMVLILLAAAVLSAVLGDYADAGAILAIVVFFVALGVFQEYQAEQAIAALKALAVPEVKVRRGGELVRLHADQLVPGDVIVLEAGDAVPADARLLEAHGVAVLEAALTGESEAVTKTVAALSDAGTPLAERINMVYSGTSLAKGRAVAVVTATGMRTELGHIAGLLQSVSSGPTPLQKRLDQVGKTLAWVAVAISTLILGLGLLQGEPLRLMLLTAISVAVAAVPEGLPAVLTITLAFGARRMLKRQALVRKLTGIETLGSVSVICSDKTGTLTQNRMEVVELVTLAGAVPPAAELRPETSLLLAAAALCNDSELRGGEAQGDPTETALLMAAVQAGLDPASLRAAMPRKLELPFDSGRKAMSTLHPLAADRPESLALLPNEPGLSVSFTKGAVDRLLEQSKTVLQDGRWVDLTDELRAGIESELERLASAGRRVLGCALRVWTQSPDSAALETELGLIGLIAMIDPPRQEAKAAVATCREAGIRPVMITGDHPLTALAIATELGIGDGQRVLTGRELDGLDADGLQKAALEVSVFARVAPEHKLRIVEALQTSGRIVAMTGDGVNDAPALKKADIGVAMGITGTDVSKEAADMVLQDDNFATIVAAVEEGRIIYDNLRKFLKFSVAGNLGKILVMLVAPLLGMPLALLPIHLLWLNLLTDGLLGLGLGLEPAEHKVMTRPPTAPDESIFGGGFIAQVLGMGTLIGALSLAPAIWLFSHDPDGPWQTVLFTSLAVGQVFQALAVRSSRDSLLSTGFSNPVLWGMIALVLGLQVLAIQLPLVQGLFHAQSLSPALLLMILAINSPVLLLAEGLKAAGKEV